MDTITALIVFCIFVPAAVSLAGWVVILLVCRRHSLDQYHLATELLRFPSGRQAEPPPPPPAHFELDRPAAGEFAPYTPPPAITLPQPPPAAVELPPEEVSATGWGRAADWQVDQIDATGETRVLRTLIPEDQADRLRKIGVSLRTDPDVPILRPPPVDVELSQAEIDSLVAPLLPPTAPEPEKTA